jgi:putative cardiolipin synthase
MIRKFMRLIFWLVICYAVAIIALRFAFPLPDISDRAESRAISASSDTAMGALMLKGMAAHADGQTGVMPLGSAQDALTSRLALIDASEASVDLQYYIWHDDISGILLLDALDRAAKRGVRVRLLVDDNGVPGLDDHLAALNAQDSFDVRLFNPSTVRNPKMLGYTFDFFRMNRRMHNKSLIVDGAVAIIGGRNIGDEYFQVGDDVFYLDMDAIAIGTVVKETAAVFDDYWNSQSVFEIETIVEGGGDRDAYLDRVTQVRAVPEAQQFIDQSGSGTNRMMSDQAVLEWTRVQVVADDPAKGIGQATRDQLMITRLFELIGNVDESLDLASAYFVPGSAGTAFFNDLVADGKRVRILTNALNTTDVFLVHAGYSRYRRELLEGGVDLFEMKLRGNPPSDDFQVLPLGLSGASLHAKTFAVDGERLFIGSFNFDPRSATLNCEMGFLIDSPSMAARVSQNFDGPIANVSYQPMLTPEGKMIWLEANANGDTTIYQEEPDASWVQQISYAVVGLLPIEWLL